MRKTDHYKTLGVAPDAGADEIKRAYRKLARKHHPDVATGPANEARFKQINEAYDTLKDPEKRREYDNPQPQPQPRGTSGASSDWDGGFGFAHPGSADAEAFSDIFRRFYDTDPHASGMHRGMAAADQHARIEISLEEAFEGASRRLTLQTPEIGPNGEVTFAERNITVRIPKGVREGQNIRLKNKGARAQSGAVGGDLYLEVVFAPHPVYRPDGSDLHLDLPITPWEAALGKKIVLPTPDGKVDLKIPKNARNGQKLRLKGKGLPSHPPGDIYATLRIVNPKVTSPQQEKFFEEMAREMSFNPRAHMGG
ncbi:MAG: DnaJ C-terminal domain-containing protein [Roseobacter sp.]|jgi:curved DNA-binding protein|nr:DnaJ C-terminal domain-containing protein [Roseobacter sp.]